MPKHYFVVAENQRIALHIVQNTIIVTLN